MTTTLRKGLADIAKQAKSLAEDMHAFNEKNSRSGTKPIEKLAHKKPVTLQVNNSGAWKSVISFDADKDMESAEVLSAAGTLGCIDGKCTFRIITNNGLQSVLMHWSAKDGWTPWRKP